MLICHDPIAVKWKHVEHGTRISARELFERFILYLVYAELV